MKLVQLYKDYFPPTVGGIEQTVERIAVQMVKHGAEVTVLTSHPGVRRTIDETIAGVRVIRCAEWGRALSAPFCPDMPGQLAKLDADICHLHYPSPPGEVSWLTVRPRGAMVVTWHIDITRQKLAMPIYGHFVRSIVRNADAVMPTYERQARRSPYLKAFEHKCHVVPLGIEIDAFERRPELEAFGAELRGRCGTPLVLFVGRLVAYKGVHVLIEAMRNLDARLVVVGGGPELERLTARTAALGLSDRVTFAGRIEPSRVVHYIAAADIGVLPSITQQETFGLAMAEMMAYGLPMVCTEVGTGTSFVNQDGESGLVVPNNDPEALAGAMRRLLDDDALRQRLGEGARARAHRLFTTDAMMRGIMDVYESVLAGRRDR